MERKLGLIAHNRLPSVRKLHLTCNTEKYWLSTEPLVSLSFMLFTFLISSALSLLADSFLETVCTKCMLENHNTCKLRNKNAFSVFLRSQLYNSFVLSPLSGKFSVVWYRFDVRMLTMNFEFLQKLFGAFIWFFQIRWVSQTGILYRLAASSKS